MGLITYLLFDIVLPLVIFAGVIGSALYFFFHTNVHVPVIESRQSNVAETSVVINAATNNSGASASSKVVTTKGQPRKESPKRARVDEAKLPPGTPVKPSRSAQKRRISSIESLPNSPNSYSVSLDEITDELHDNFSFLQVFVTLFVLVKI